MDRPARRAKRFLSAEQKYDLWLRMLSGQITTVAAAAEAGVDRTTIMTLRKVAKDGAIAALQASRPGRFRAIQALEGVGPVLGAVFVAEIGDVTRFAGPAQVASWAGLTPRHRESDTTVRRGPITKMGSRLVRWAAIEAISRRHGGAVLQGHYRRIAERRGNRNIARVAVARRLLGLVYYGLRDGEIRCLAAAG